MGEFQGRNPNWSDQKSWLASWKGVGPRVGSVLLLRPAWIWAADLSLAQAQRAVVCLCACLANLHVYLLICLLLMHLFSCNLCIFAVGWRPCPEPHVC